ncbi:MAG: hypothetical protein M3Q89_01065 [Verrucomicrobiota bacterium]|nr:hypothetical protein [Verrucomicrobiota bacterium]
MKAARGFKRGAFGFVGVLSLAVLATRCQKTGKLSPDLTARFEKEGIVHRADDLTFRRTFVEGERDGSWDERRASIVVTPESVYLHVNGKPLVARVESQVGEQAWTR